MDRLPVYHSANTYRQRNTFAPTGTLESLGHLTWPNAFGLHAETEAHGRSSCRHVENTQKCSLCIITISVKITHSNPLLVWLSVTSISLLFKTHICGFFLLTKRAHGGHCLSWSLSAYLQLQCTLILVFFHSLSSKHLSPSPTLPWEPLSASLYPEAFLCLLLILYSHH